MARKQALLGDWRGMSLDDILRLCRDTVEEADYGRAVDAIYRAFCG